MDYLEQPLDNGVDHHEDYSSEVMHSEEYVHNGYDQHAEHGEYQMPSNEFELMSSVVGDGIQKEKEMGISCVAFDKCEDLLWIGTKSGHVTSYYGPQLQKYTSFQVHPTDQVRNIATVDDGILVLTNTSLRSQIRRGIPCYTHTADNMIDMHSLFYNSRTHRAVMSGMQDKLIDFDPIKVKEVNVVDNEGTCAILRDHSRFICCGDAPNGRVRLRDPLTLEHIQTLDAHSGTLSDFDVHGYHLVTCGTSARHGMEHPDKYLMIYDLRIMRAISPIQCMVVPFQLRFLPAMSSRIAVMAASGQVQIVDTADISTTHISLMQVSMPIDSCNTISMDISPSNQCMAFGDTANSIHLFSSVPDAVLHPFPRETEFADQVEQLTPMSISDELTTVYSSVPRPHLPHGETSYLCDYWPERFSRQIYRPTPDVEPEILRNVKMVGAVGYAPNTSNKRRNQVKYVNVRHTSDAHKNDNHVSEESGLNLIPPHYRRKEIKYSKIGQEEFDFDRFNRTGFCGLEASLPNSYCNAMLQIYYYTEKFRILILNHTCTRESCIACELSYLFHMMDISPPSYHGLPVQSSNFLRALRTIPEASALGLIFTDQNSVWKTSIPRLLQSWNRFLLQQTNMQCTDPGKEEAKGVNFLQLKPKKWAGRMSSPMKTAKPSSQTELEDISREISAVFDHEEEKTEEGEESSVDDEPMVSKIFGMKQDKVNFCTKCKTNVVSRSTMLLCNMIYPDYTSAPAETSFAEVVCSSLTPYQTTQAWCDKCRKYQQTNQSRKLKTMPHVLSLNTGMDSPQDLAFWQTQMEMMYNKHIKPLEPSPAPEEPEPVRAAPPPNVKPCRYGLSCNRPDCKFWHPEQESGASNPKDMDIADKMYQHGLSWVPHQMQLHCKKDGTVSTEESEDTVESKTYNLYAVCSYILDPSTGQSTNIVSTINIGPTYHARVASPVSQWYCLNDFRINTISAMEAVWFNLNWKVPCVLFYQSLDEPEVIKSLEHKNPLTAEVFLEDKSLAQRSSRNKRCAMTFQPLGPEEMPPKKGELVAIDAEFVTLNQEESELRSDGKLSMIKAAHLTVARITCVRGGGPAAGVPFIDDYISTQEQVVDYLTKFSGIKPGDLDANFSSKHLTTLKSTYQKLRFLVDTGCIFVGHGLKNDFRVINIVVPHEQVIDTVHLFHLPHHRMVSLKFLTWHFLKRKIQGVTHDSIEDAVAALDLYKKYLQLKEEGKLIEALNDLYDVGKEHNWKIPED